MSVKKGKSKSLSIESWMSALREVISSRMQAHIAGEDPDIVPVLEKALSRDDFRKEISSYFPLLQSNDEWVILFLALILHIRPNYFESIIISYLPNGGDFPEFGGVKGSNHRGLLPTGETAQFILAGNDPDKRLTIHQYFREEHFFFRQGILWLEPVREGDPVMSGRIILSQE